MLEMILIFFDITHCARDRGINVRYTLYHPLRNPKPSGVLEDGAQRALIVRVAEEASVLFQIHKLKAGHHVLCVFRRNSKPPPNNICRFLRVLFDVSDRSFPPSNKLHQRFTRRGEKLARDEDINDRSRK